MKSNGLITFKDVVGLAGMAAPNIGRLKPIIIGLTRGTLHTWKQVNPFFICFVTGGTVRMLVIYIVSGIIKAILIIIHKGIFFFISQHLVLLLQFLILFNQAGSHVFKVYYGTYQVSILDRIRHIQSTLGNLHQIGHVAPPCGKDFCVATQSYHGEGLFINPIGGAS